MLVTIDAIRAAAARIAGAVERTPCPAQPHAFAPHRLRAVLKFENLQFTASFKERGALNKLLSLGEAERKRGVIAMSAGNHAQAVAYHAARLGIPATIVMPKGSPNTKIKNTQVHGATVVLEGENLFEAGKHARELAARDNLVFVHPYEDPLIIAGQGTVGARDARRGARPRRPRGAGGRRRPDLGHRHRGEGAQAQDPHPRRRIEELPVDAPAPRRPCRSSAAATPSPRASRSRTSATSPSSIIRELVEEVLVVEEETIERAVVALIEIEKTVAEGAGAAALAALLAASAALFAGQARRHPDLGRQHRQPRARLGADARAGARWRASCACA